MGTPAKMARDLPSWHRRLGVTGLYLFATFAFMGTAGAFIGLAVMLIATLLDGPRFWRAIRDDRLLWLLAFAALAGSVTLGLALARNPQQVAVQLGAANTVLQLTLFLLIAWWLQGNERRIHLILLLTLTGFVIGSVRALDAEELRALLDLQRPNFIWSINAFAQYAAAALIGLTLLAPRLWHWLDGKRVKWPLTIALSGLAALLFSALILAQSRGVFLALVVTSIGILAFLLFTNPRPQLIVRAKRHLLPLGLLAVSLIVISGPVVYKRFDIDYRSLFAYLQSGEGLESIPNQSVRERLQFVRLGIDYGMERPLFGWGLGTIPGLLQQNQDKLFGDARRYHDFHTISIDLFVAFGLVGTIAMLLLFLWVLRALLRAYQEKLVQRDLCLLILTLLLFNVISQLTDTRLFSPHGRFYWILFAGIAYTWSLNRSTSAVKNQETEKPPAANARR